MKTPLTERPDRSLALKERLKLHIAAESGNKPKESNPTELSIKQVHISTALFQPRDSLVYEWASRDHVRNLAEALKRDASKQRRLEPITVMAFGNRWYLLDGHHRLQAYKDAGYDRVAVRVVDSEAQGSERVLEAQKIGLRSNSRDKLPMTSSDKSNAAWRLVASETDLTAKEIEELTQVSERTVRSMRETLRKLKAENKLISPEGMSWRHAKMTADGKDLPELEADDRIERQAVKMAKKLRKHFGEELIRFTEVTKRALTLYDPSLPEALGVSLEEPERA